MTNTTNDKDSQSDKNFEQPAEKKQKNGRGFIKKFTVNQLGLFTVSLGFKTIGSFWKNLTHPICPECNNGFLQLSKHDVEESDSEDALYVHICNKCNFSIASGKSRKELESILGSIRQQKTQERFKQIENTEYQKIIKGHKLQSRFYYILCGLCFLGFLYLLAFNPKIIISINWLAFCFLFFVCALKKSYRYWQICTGTLYQKGSFRFWFKSGQWFI